MNIAGSNQGASSAYTELGPPEMIIALWIQGRESVKNPLTANFYPEGHAPSPVKH